MSNSPVISIVIVSFQVKEMVVDCIRSIYATTKSPFEIILVDNASTDGTVETIRGEFPNVNILAESTNHGFSPGNNHGMDASLGEYILLLNPDTIVLPGAIDKLLQKHIDSKSGLSSPKLLNQDRSLQVSAWKFPKMIDSLLELFYLHRLFRRNEYAPETFQKSFHPDAVSGAAMIFHKDIYKNIGGLDPVLFWMEDTDLSYRIKKSGMIVSYFPETEIIHIGGQSSKKNYNRTISNQLISKLKFSRKHYGKLHSFFLGIIILFHIITRILIFHLIRLFKKEPRAEAYRYTLRKLSRYWFKNDMSI